MVMYKCRFLNAELGKDGYMVRSGDGIKIKMHQRQRHWALKIRIVLKGKKVF